MTNSLWAQERAAPLDPYSEPRPYPDDAHITVELHMSNPRLLIECRGTGAASRVTKLDIYLIYLGKIPNEPDSHALYYSFSTEYAQQATGFALGGKLTPLTCQMIGLRLDYSGPPKGNASLTSQKKE